MPDVKKSRNISLRLFLDGIETRVVGATVKHSPHKPDTASIKVPPHPVIEGIKEKTLAHLFYNDENLSNEPDDEEFKLLFEGEITGTQTQLSQGGQNKTLQARSIAGHLKQSKVHQTFLSSPNGFNINQIDTRQKVEGQREVNIATQSIGGDIRSQMEQAIIDAENLITDPEEDEPGGILEMMRLVFEHNTFLQDIMRRLRILDRFPEVESSAQIDVDELIKQENVSKLIRGTIGDVQAEYPILALVNKILNIFFYSLNMNASVLNTFNPVPRLHNAPPPSCNIIEPDQFSRISFSENHQAKPTRTALTLAPLGIKQVYIWPPDLQQPMELFENKTLESYKNFERMFTDEELVKGPRPHVVNAKQKIPAGKEKEDQARKFYMSKAQYNFDIARRNANNLSVTGSFNPEVFPGFSTFIVAPSIDVIFGYLASVTHSIDNQNNTATTQYQVAMPYKLLTNPDSLAPPQTNPSINIGDQEDRVPIEELNKIYNSVMNEFFEDNAVGTRGEVSTLPVSDSHIDKYFNGRFDKEKYRENPVLRQAVVAMGQHLSPNSFIGKNPNNRIIKTVERGDRLTEIAENTPYSVEELANASGIDNPDNISVGDKILSPKTASGGQFFKKRAHANINMVFGEFYKAGKINKKHTDSGVDIWDLYNTNEIDYLADDLDKEKEGIKLEIKQINKKMEQLKEQLNNLDDTKLLQEPGTNKEDIRQDINNRIKTYERNIENLQQQVNNIDSQIDTIEDEGEKPVLLKTEYDEDGMKNYLQKRQEIIITYNEELTKSQGSIVGNMNLFMNEILEDNDAQPSG